MIVYKKIKTICDPIEMFSILLYPCIGIYLFFVNLNCYLLSPKGGGNRGRQPWCPRTIFNVPAVQISKNKIFHFFHSFFTKIYFFIKQFQSIYLNKTNIQQSMIF